MMTKIILALMVTLVLHSKLSYACVCDSLKDRHFQEQYCGADFVLKAKVTGRKDRPDFRIPSPPGSVTFDSGFQDDVFETNLFVKYDIEVSTVFENRKDLAVPTNIWSYHVGQCQVTFQPGETYLILGNYDGKYVSASMCEYNKPWDGLSDFQRKYMEKGKYRDACSECEADYCIDCTGLDYCCKQLDSTNQDNFCQVKKSESGELDLKLVCLSRYSYCDRKKGKCTFIKGKDYKECMKGKKKKERKNHQ